VPVGQRPEAATSLQEPRRATIRQPTRLAYSSCEGRSARYPQNISPQNSPINTSHLDGLDKRAQQVQVDAQEAVPDEGPRAGQDLDAWDAGDSKDAAARSLP
jgi:hypothetical protein